MRSTENARISRHNVIRGKKDAARRGRWPGGPRPFGFRHRRVIDDAAEPADVYDVLEVEPSQAFALKLRTKLTACRAAQSLLHPHRTASVARKRSSSRSMIGVENQTFEWENQTRNQTHFQCFRRAGRRLIP
jgi:hypothetical protein